jgi:zinc/manganese transport system substrate-binding protein
MCPTWSARAPMRTIARSVPTFGLVLIMTVGSAAQEAKVSVVAAENFYGDIAQQVGGNLVEVVSIMSNPDQDPHLFETTPTVIRQVGAAQVLIFNGADYDPWMNKLISATPRAGRIVVDVAELMGTKRGANPHLWYAPATIPAVAKALVRALSKADAPHASDYASRQEAFEASLTPIFKKIDQIRAKYAGTVVTATEPVFGYMVSALGLKMRNERFQLAVMNDTEPSARDIAAFEQDLKEGKVRVLLFNKQASTKLTQRMLEVARRSNIRVVGVTETEPAGMSYQDWMLMQLDELQKALGDSSA